MACKLNRVVKCGSELDALFAALADRTRRGMVEALADGGERAVSELAAPWRMSLPAAAKHLRVLEEAGLVVSRKRGRVRWCRLRPERLAPVVDWLAHWRAFWSGRLDELERFLAQQPSSRRRP